MSTSPNAADLARDLASLAAAHDALLTYLHGLTDAQARAESLLPGWTVGHVVTHLARNAEAVCRMVDAAGRGEVGQMYPGGREQRSADIDAGAGRPAVELLADVTAASVRLDGALAALPLEAFDRTGDALSTTRTIAELPYLRRREVEVHRVDLGLGYGWDQWPADFVRAETRRMTMLWTSRRPMGMTVLPPAAQRADDNLRLAWLFGRAWIDGVAPAGIY